MGFAGKKCCPPLQGKLNPKYKPFHNGKYGQLKGYLKNRQLPAGHKKGRHPVPALLQNTW
jgi:hypothetical protein